MDVKSPSPLAAAVLAQYADQRAKALDAALAANAQGRKQEALDLLTVAGSFAVAMEMLIKADGEKNDAS